MQYRVQCTVYSAVQIQIYTVDSRYTDTDTVSSLKLLLKSKFAKSKNLNNNNYIHRPRFEAVLNRTRGGFTLTSCFPSRIYCWTF